MAQIVVPSFGYKNLVAIDRQYVLIRDWSATTANIYDDAQLMNVLDRRNTGLAVWAGSAYYRSKENEAVCAFAPLESRALRSKPASPTSPTTCAGLSGSPSAPLLCK